MTPLVQGAVLDVSQHLEALLKGTVELSASLVELSCLISEPGAPRQNVHVDTGGWKTCCSPLLTVFLPLQEVKEPMGPTILPHGIEMLL